MSLCGLWKRNEGNSQRKRRRKNASNVLNYSFAPDDTFRFILSMHKSIRKILLDLDLDLDLHARNFWGVLLHI